MAVNVVVDVNFGTQADERLFRPGTLFLSISAVSYENEMGRPGEVSEVAELVFAAMDALRTEAVDGTLRKALTSPNGLGVAYVNMGYAAQEAAQ